MNICSLLKFQGRPLVRRIKGGFVKLNLRSPSQRKKTIPSFTKGGPFQRRFRGSGPREPLYLTFDEFSVYYAEFVQCWDILH